MGKFNNGVAHLARRFVDLPFYPVFLFGQGKSLPRGDSVLVPYFRVVFVGESMTWTGGKVELMRALAEQMNSLADRSNLASWA